MCGVTQALQNAQWVLYDEAYFVDVRVAGSIVGAVSSVTQVQGQVLGETALDYVANVGIAFPVLALTTAIGRNNLGATNVAGHQAQARYAELGEVQVVTHLVRLLALLGEVVVLNVVQDIDRAATVITVLVTTSMVAFNFLTANGERVRANVVGNGQAANVVLAGTVKSNIFVFVASAVRIEINSYALVVSNRVNVVYVQVLFFCFCTTSTFVAQIGIGVIVSGTQIVSKIVATTSQVDGTQPASISAIATSLIHCT